jgi:predicted solute-binding protein
MWYKLTAQHGPGHQGATEEYIWSCKLEADDRKDTWNRWVATNGFQQALGQIAMVRKIPLDTIKKLTKHHQQRVKLSTHILKALKKMKEKE